MFDQKMADCLAKRHLANFSCPAKATNRLQYRQAWVSTNKRSIFMNDSLIKYVSVAAVYLNIVQINLAGL